MHLRDYAHAVRRSVLIIISLTLVGLVLGALVAYVQPPTYRSTTRMYVSTRTAADANSLNLGAQFAQQVTKSYAAVATSAVVLDAVIDRLDLNESATTLADHVEASGSTDSLQIEIDVTDGSADRAALIANAIRAEVVDQTTRLTQVTATTSPVRLVTVEVATSDDRAVSPIIPLYLVVGLLVGLALGLLIAVLRELLDPRVDGVDPLHRSGGVPVLGAIPHDGRARRSPIAAGNDRRAPAFRALRGDLLAKQPESGSQVLTITSPNGGEGTSQTAANLAAVLAEEGGLSVLLIDANLRAPALADMLALSSGAGLAEVLRGSVSFDDAVRAHDRGFDVLAGREAADKPGALLRSSELNQLLQNETPRYDLVLIDTPSLDAGSDASVLARQTIGALLVVASGRTKRPDAEAAIERLTESGAHVLGIVVNRAPRRRSTRSRRRPVAGSTSGIRDSRDARTPITDGATS